MRLMITLAAGSVLLAGCGGAATSSNVAIATSAPAAPTAPAATEHDVVVFVTGTTTVADLTLRIGNSQSQHRGVDVPVKSKTGEPGIRFTANGGDLVYLSAQNAKDYGTIGCELTIDGVSITSNESSGGFTIATCESVVP